MYPHVEIEQTLNEFTWVCASVSNFSAVTETHLRLLDVHRPQ